MRTYRCNQKVFESGVSIGPPQDKEYPVEPVGVEIIKPSDQYVQINLLSMKQCILIIDEESFFIIDISFKAKLF